MSTWQRTWKLVETVIREWHISISLPGCGVVDNAHNFIMAIACIEWTSIACSAHTLGLCVPDAKNAIPEFRDLCSTVKAVVEYHKRSSHARAKLHDIHKTVGVKELGIVQDVYMCWSSEFLMMSNFTEFWGITAVHLASTGVHNTFTATKDICLLVCVEANQRSYNVCMLCDISHTIKGYPSPALCAHCAWKRTPRGISFGWCLVSGDATYPIPQSKVALSMPRVMRGEWIEVVNSGSRGLSQAPADGLFHNSGTFPHVWTWTVGDPWEHLLFSTAWIDLKKNLLTSNNPQTKHFSVASKPFSAKYVVLSSADSNRSKEKPVLLL